MYAIISQIKQYEFGGSTLPSHDICAILDYCKPFADILKESDISNASSTEELKEHIYRTVKRERAIEDAESQVMNYCNHNEIDNNPLSLANYEALADCFLKNHDYELADNDQWQDFIADYVSDVKVTETERNAQFHAFLKENSLRKTAFFEEVKECIHQTMVWADTLQQAKIQTQEYCTRRGLTNTVTQSQYESMAQTMLSRLSEHDALTEWRNISDDT